MAIEWFRAYHGITSDRKYLGVARRAGPGVTPGHVAAVWIALLDHASVSSPRGSIATFDPEGLADFYGWPEEMIQAVLDALIARGLIADGRLARWSERQPEKTDRTATVRKQRQRERQKQAAEVESGPPSNDQCHDMSRRDIGDCHTVTPVTPLEEKEQSKSSFSDASKQASNTSLKLDTPRTVREQAGAVIDGREFWQWAEAHGMPAHIGVRMIQGARLREWIESGLSMQALDESLTRAKAKRLAQRSRAPVNLGFLACFIDEVLAGVGPANTTTGGTNERGDQLSREFATAR